jgi:hypothetical protein
VARLLVKNNRLAVRNGRLITTAGGAPCCCGDELCACGGLVTNREYTGCNESNRQTRLPFPPYRRVTVETQYATTSRTVVSGNAGGGNYAEEQGVSGSATLCFVDASLSVVAGESVWYNRREGAGANFNLENVEAAGGAFRVGIPSTGSGGYVLGPILFWSANGAIPNNDMSPQLKAGLVALERRECVYVYDYDDGTTTIRERFTYTDGPSGGSVTAETLERTQAFGILNLAERTSTLTWTRTIDLCEGGGGDTPNRPGGCSGCGDPSRLTII